MKLIRTDFRPDGIFGKLLDDSGTQLAVTLEHSYNNLPKIPDGDYTCQRSQHRLHGMTQDFETFQVMNVPGHDNILFHWGNFNKDSEGCILLGESIAQTGPQEMITNSRASWQKFMDTLSGCQTFDLAVSTS